MSSVVQRLLKHSVEQVSRRKLRRDALTCRNRICAQEARARTPWHSGQRDGSGVTFAQAKTAASMSQPSSTSSEGRYHRRTNVIAEGHSGTTPKAPPKRLGRSEHGNSQGLPPKRLRRRALPTAPKALLLHFTAPIPSPTKYVSPRGHPISTPLSISWDLRSWASPL